jgi:hypothetical protein
MTALLQRLLLHSLEVFTSFICAAGKTVSPSLHYVYDTVRQQQRRISLSEAVSSYLQFFFTKTKFLWPVSVHRVITF